MKLLIVGGGDRGNVGECLYAAAAQLGISAQLIDTAEAMRAPQLIRMFNWYFRGRRPTRLRPFSRMVVEQCRASRPDIVLTTGNAPIDATALSILGSLGIRRVNYSTDDPWSRIHYAPWFFQALPLYDTVYTPRRANMADLLNIGVPQVEYLPFAYDPRLHFAESPATEKEKKAYQADVVFIGGADADRVPIIAALLSEGFSVALYGSYWERYRETRAVTRGRAGHRTMRLATREAKVSLCLVRRANRDGHVMRSFEIAAIGGCLLAEDTEEHRTIFGAEEEAAYYFKSEREMIEKVKKLFDDGPLNKALRKNITQYISDGKNTYKDRIRHILRIAGIKDACD